jgi:hypothetical protein
MPLVMNNVKISVTNAAKENLDLHIALGRLSARNGRQPEARSRARGGVGFGDGRIRFHDV